MRYLRAVAGILAIVAGSGIAFMFGIPHAKSQVTDVTVSSLGDVNSFVASVLGRITSLEGQQGSTKASQVQDEANISTWATQISALTSRVQILEAKLAVTPTPTPTPTPTTTPTAIAIGATVTTSGATNVRATPGGTLLSQVPAGSSGKVVSGPSPVINNTVWWQVQFPSVNGWAGVDMLTCCQ